MTDLDAALEGVNTIMYYRGHQGLGWYVRLRNQGFFSFGATVGEALAAARSPDRLKKITEPAPKAKVRTRVRVVAPVPQDPYLDGITRRRERVRILKQFPSLFD